MALSRLADPADPDCVIATAHQGGRLRGMLHFVPWGPDGLSLDLMRRDPDADNGLNEYVIANVIDACAALGVTRVSLNFAMFRDALERGEKIGAGPACRAWRALLIFLSRFWQIESLYRFNVKFRPCWEPRCISYPAARDLPRIALAALGRRHSSPSPASSSACSGGHSRCAPHRCPVSPARRARVTVGLDSGGDAGGKPRCRRPRRQRVLRGCRDRLATGPQP
jgi:lysylphosphatidylglycerol synthetase-like protein (DUF2156 family)